MTKEEVYRLLDGVSGEIYDQVFYEYDPYEWTEDEYRALIMAIKILKNLPSAQPERKTGKWIEPKSKGWISYNVKAYVECSECGNVQFLGARMNYCPNCGSYNGGGDDDV